MIHTIGDSHAKYSFDGIVGVICHHIGPVTMESVGKMRQSKSSSIYLEEILIEHKIKNDEVVILCFGEIDVRCRIKPKINNGENEDNVIKSLVSNYIETINNTNHKNFWILGVIPPTCFREETHGYPFLGSDEERSIYCRKINLSLKEMCKKNGIVFLDIYELYKDDRGMLKKELSDNNVHIGNTEFVKELIDVQLSNNA